MNSRKRLLQGGALVLIVLSCIQTRLKPRNKTVNMDYVSKARKIYDGGPAVSIISSDFLKRDWSKNINLYPPSPSLKMYFDDYNPVSLSVFEVPKSEDSQFEHALQNIRRNSVLYRYIALQKKNNSFVSIEQSKLDFIQQKKVHYIFTYGDARMPETLRPSVIDSVRDSISRITLYRLKQERSSF
jgi:hypothetical protein